MASHPYELFRDNSASSLGRSRTLNGILSRLAAHHLSVTGLRYFGKTMLLRVVEQTAKSGSVFAHVVYWDLRHRTPDCDESFFNAFAECLACEIGDGEVREFLKDGTFTSIKGVFDYLKVNGERVLLIMDGMDQPLGSENLSPNVWDNLCALAANPSISIVTGSRKRLRQLCANPSSRTSDFWERFHDPVVELHAFTEDELHEFLAPLSELRALDRGCEREFMNWTGGVPVLSVALAARLAEGSKGPVCTQEVGSAADDLLREQVDIVEGAWETFSGEQHSAFAEIVERQEISKAEAGRIAHLLSGSGLIEIVGNKIRSTCRLLQRHSEGLRAGLLSVRVLFGNPPDYEQNIRGVVMCRLRQIQIADSDLRDFVESAVGNINKPKMCLKDMRSIIEHSLDLLWKIESPSGDMPRFTSEYGLKVIREVGSNLPPAADTAKRLRCLDLLTDSRNGVIPKKANRKIYALLNGLKGLGDLGQHQAGLVVSPFYAAAACATAIELAAELALAGIA